MTDWEPPHNAQGSLQASAPAFLQKTQQHRNADNQFHTNEQMMASGVRRARASHARLAVVLIVVILSIIWLNRASDLGAKRSETEGQAEQHTALLLRQRYSAVLVFGKLWNQNTDWTARDLPGFKTAAYVVDDPTASLSLPRNKGREAMVYLSYIIDHYNQLPDISVFIHAHQAAWHNDGLLGKRTSVIIRRLNGAHVMRQGYVNLRCEWSPGCPRLIGPGGVAEGVDEKEAAIFRQSWTEIHEGIPMPTEIATPCCAQ